MKNVSRRGTAIAAAAMSVVLVAPSITPAHGVEGEITVGKDGVQGTIVAGQQNELSQECKNVLLGFGIPLVSLIPLGLLAQLALGGASNVTNVIDQQIRNFNTEIQRQAGILNPELAAQVEAFDKYLTAYGYSIASVTVGLTALAGGLTASGVILNECLKGNSITEVEITGGSSGQLIKPKATNTSTSSATPTATATATTTAEATATVTETKSETTVTETSTTTTTATTTEPAPAPAS